MFTAENMRLTKVFNNFHKVSLVNDVEVETRSLALKIMILEMYEN